MGVSLVVCVFECCPVLSGCSLYSDQNLIHSCEALSRPHRVLLPPSPSSLSCCWHRGGGWSSAALLSCSVCCCPISVLRQSVSSVSEHRHSVVQDASGFCPICRCFQRCLLASLGCCCFLCCACGASVSFGSSVSFALCLCCLFSSSVCRLCHHCLSLSCSVVLSLAI